MSLLSAAKARYSHAATRARLQAALNLQAVLKLPFSITEWSNRSSDALTEQWPLSGRRPDSSWNWPQIQRDFKTDPTKFELAVWGDNRLSCLAIANLSNSAVVLRFLEGDPRADCPFRGVRTLIVLEAIQCCGLTTGRNEIQVEPVNDALATLYRNNYGFALATRKGGNAYYRREIA